MHIWLLSNWVSLKSIENFLLNKSKNNETFDYRGNNSYFYQMDVMPERITCKAHALAKNIELS